MLAIKELVCDHAMPQMRQGIVLNVLTHAFVRILVKHSERRRLAPH